jgi:hypothetical protein
VAALEFLGAALFAGPPVVPPRRFPQQVCPAEE